VLTPELAAKKFAWVKSEIDELSVVGIAGPGDALAEWQSTKETIQKIKAMNADIIFCLSTNGLLLPYYAQEIVDLGIGHVTVTVNAIDAEIGAKIYRHVIYKNKYYQGVEAAKILLKNQLSGIEYLTAHGILVKINIVMVKGINDAHIPEVVKKVKSLGVFVTNIMPLIPAAGSAFENFPQTSMKEVSELRNRCELDIQQMRHCQQCRADAIGRLNQDRSQEFRMCNCPSANIKVPYDSRRLYKIAVTSKYGKLVDLHFGHATQFAIYEGNGEKFTLLETRAAAKFCEGMAKCGEEEAQRAQAIAVLADCQAVLTMRIGQHAKDKLAEKGIKTIEFCDSVENGLRYAVSKLTGTPLLNNEGAYLDEGLSG
jgi:nitrogen fixation protein NifB